MLPSTTNLKPPDSKFGPALSGIVNGNKVIISPDGKHYWNGNNWLIVPGNASEDSDNNSTSGGSGNSSNDSEDYRQFLLGRRSKGSRVEFPPEGLVLSRQYEKLVNKHNDNQKGLETIERQSIINQRFVSLMVAASYSGGRLPPDGKNIIWDKFIGGLNKTAQLFLGVPKIPLTHKVEYDVGGKKYTASMNDMAKRIDKTGALRFETLSPDAQTAFLNSWEKAASKQGKIFGNIQKARNIFAVVTGVFGGLTLIVVKLFLAEAAIASGIVSFQTFTIIFPQVMIGVGAFAALVIAIYAVHHIVNDIRARNVTARNIERAETVNDYTQEAFKKQENLLKGSNVALDDVIEMEAKRQLPTAQQNRPSVNRQYQPREINQMNQRTAAIIGTAPERRDNEQRSMPTDDRRSQRITARSNENVRPAGYNNPPMVTINIPGRETQRRSIPSRYNNDDYLQPKPYQSGIEDNFTLRQSVNNQTRYNISNDSNYRRNDYNDDSNYRRHNNHRDYYSEEQPYRRSRLPVSASQPPNYQMEVNGYRRDNNNYQVKQSTYRPSLNRMPRDNEYVSNTRKKPSATYVSPSSSYSSIDDSDDERKLLVPSKKVSNSQLPPQNNTNNRQDDGQQEQRPYSHVKNFTERNNRNPNSIESYRQRVRPDEHYDDSIEPFNPTKQTA